MKTSWMMFLLESGHLEQVNTPLLEKSVKQSPQTVPVYPSEQIPVKYDSFPARHEVETGHAIQFSVVAFLLQNPFLGAVLFPPKQRALLAQFVHVVMDVGASYKKVPLPHLVQANAEVYCSPSLQFLKVTSIWKGEELDPVKLRVFPYDSRPEIWRKRSDLVPGYWYITIEVKL